MWKDVLSKIAAVQTKLGTPADTDVSTDIANVQTAVDNIEGVTAKQAAFFGENIQPVLNESFLMGADGAAPNTAYWNVIVDDGASVTLQRTQYSYSYLRVYAGATGGSDAITYGKDLVTWIPGHAGTTSLNWEGYVRCVDLTGHFTFGLHRFSDSNGTPTTIIAGNKDKFMINCLNDSVSAATGDNTAIQATDISAYFTENTWLKIKMVCTASDVKFYIDDTLRATHSTRVPDYAMTTNMGATNTGGIATDLQFMNIQVWAE